MRAPTGPLRKSLQRGGQGRGHSGKGGRRSRAQVCVRAGVPDGQWQQTCNIPGCRSGGWASPTHPTGSRPASQVARPGSTGGRVILSAAAPTAGEYDMHASCAGPAPACATSSACWMQQRAGLLHAVSKAVAGSGTDCNSRSWLIFLVIHP